MVGSSLMPPKPSSLDLSVVAPVYNESESIEAFCAELREVLDAMGVSYEVLFIDDGSTDDSVAIIRRFAWPQARVISFVSNAGHMAALDAGYRAALGRYVVSLDSDLQHPPGLIPNLFSTAVAGRLDVVYAVRDSRRSDGWFKKVSALAYYRLMRTLTDVDVHDSAADFRLISSRVITVIRSLPAGRQVFRLLIPSLGFPSATVGYLANPRFAGRSKYNFGRMLSLSNESIVGFTTKPLTFSIRLGLLVSGLAVLGFIYVLLAYFSGQALEGWASILATILLMFGILFVTLGVFGLYIGALVSASSGRPRYLIDETDEAAEQWPADWATEDSL